MTVGRLQRLLVADSGLPLTSLNRDAGRCRRWLAYQPVTEQNYTTVTVIPDVLVGPIDRSVNSIRITSVQYAQLYSCQRTLTRRMAIANKTCVSGKKLRTEDMYSRSEEIAASCICGILEQLY